MAESSKDSHGAQCTVHKIVMEENRGWNPGKIHSAARFYILLI